MTRKWKFSDEHIKRAPSSEMGISALVDTAALLSAAKKLIQSIDGNADWSALRDAQNELRAAVEEADMAMAHLVRS